MVYLIGSEEVDANSLVRGRLASNVGTATISITYFMHW